MPWSSTSPENERRTAERTDWSTGRIALPSFHFGACLRKMDERAPREIRPPFTWWWTMTR